MPVPGKPVVFEIQLSYTFLSDVLEWDAFYRAEGIFIVWVFAQFDLQRAAVTDEAYFNHRNLFILDAAALDQTVVTQTLTFSGSPDSASQRLQSPRRLHFKMCELEIDGISCRHFLAVLFQLRGRAKTLPDQRA